jgi:hypothetical protein
LIRTLKGLMAGVGTIPAVLLLIVLVHASGSFFYLTLWRTAFAADFDVNDFKAYYAGAIALSEDRPDLLYPDASTLNLGVLPDQPWVQFAVERGVPTPSGYIYPPFLAVVLQPITQLSYHRANQLWFLLNIGMFVISIMALASWSPSGKNRGANVLAAGALIFTALNFYPVFRALQTGQVSLLILFLLAAALWFLQRGKEIPAGALVGLATAVKLTPGILVIYFLVARKYKAAAAAAGAGILALAVSVGGAGIGNHFQFVNEMLPALSRGAATFANQSISGFLIRLVMDTTINAFEFVDEPGWVRFLARGLSVSVLLASLWLGRKLALRGETAAGYGLVVLASLMASPISWEHHYTVALIPIAILMTRLATDEKIHWVEWIAVMAGIVLMAANSYDFIRNHLSFAMSRLAISYALYGACLIWLVLARKALGPGERLES